MQAEGVHAFVVGWSGVPPVQPVGVPVAVLVWFWPEVQAVSDGVQSPYAQGLVHVQVCVSTGADVGGTVQSGGR